VIREAFATTPGSVGFEPRTSLNISRETRENTRLAVALAKAGDRDAIRFLYISYSNNVYGYVRSIIRDDHEAEDVTQHVFTKLMTSLEKYDDRGIPFFAWLLRVARNVSIDHLRANRLTPTEAVLEAEPGHGLDLDRAETVRVALRSLSEDQKTVVFLRHVVGLTSGEIAARMGRTESSVHGLHHRGRRALQRELTRLESTPCTRRVRKLAAA
jgi:RNA polymerase sigma-70 factor (ECF subfamily)